MDKRFIIIAIILILMWLGLMVFYYLKADEVTNSPCEVCAKKLGENVMCSTDSGGMIISRTYYPNLSYSDV